MHNVQSKRSFFPRHLLTDPRLREVLWFCLPALLAGLALRVVLTIQMPYGYFQYDSVDILTTPYRWLVGHQVLRDGHAAFVPGHDIVIHGKRAFLTPLLMTIPFLIGVPALIAIPIAQHILGLASVLLAGGLVRLWFRHWRWFIVPVTLLVATSPWLIWYEHALMGEAQFLFFTFAAALAGTVWARWPSRGTFLLFFAAMLLEAGTRAEGKLFYAFAIILVPLVLWGQWKRLFLCLACMAVVAFIFLTVHQTNSAPSLLYASLVNLTPDHPESAPGIEPYVIPIRDATRAEWIDFPTNLVRVSEKVDDAAQAYVAAKKPPHRDKASVLQGLSLDVLKAHPLTVLLLPVKKFNLAIDSWSSDGFSRQFVYDAQEYAIERKPWIQDILSRGLTGKQMNLDEMKAFIHAHYNPDKMAWFDAYQQGWNDAANQFRLPDKHTDKKRWVHDLHGGVPDADHTIPGMPLFYILAFAGMAAAMLRPSPATLVQWAWVPAMVGVLYCATLAGVTNARFRFVDEPFFYIYLFLLADCLWDAFQFIALKMSRK